MRLSQVFCVTLFTIVASISCQREELQKTAAEKSTGPKPLFRTAQGELVSTECVDALGGPRNPSNIKRCIFDPKLTASDYRYFTNLQPSQRGFFDSNVSSSWANSYYDFFYFYNYVPVINPYYYNQPAICNYLNYGPYCSIILSLYGYQDWTPVGPSCDVCVRFPWSTFCRTSCQAEEPAPPPEPQKKPASNPCHGLQGNYSGSCVAAGGASTPISFTVQAQGDKCVATNSGVFQTTVLYGGQASPAGYPGGVAITQTNLVVRGSGSFTLTGYNYAGNFHFQCQ